MQQLAAKEQILFERHNFPVFDLSLSPLVAKANNTSSSPFTVEAFFLHAVISTRPPQLIQYPVKGGVEESCPIGLVPVTLCFLSQTLPISLKIDCHYHWLLLRYLIA
jgi:hypothetical protein